MEDSQFSSHDRIVPLFGGGSAAPISAFEITEWLDLRALCRYACASERTLREWIHRPSDALPAYRIAAKIFVKRSEFDAWIRGHVIRSASKEKIEQIVDEVIRQVTDTY